MAKADEERNKNIHISFKNTVITTKKLKRESKKVTPQRVDLVGDTFIFHFTNFNTVRISMFICMFYFYHSFQKKSV